MAVKLGEMLVKGGVVTLEQLEEALKYQVIFGGKLGTNLIELGFVEEEGIAWFLSEKLGVPYVHPDKLMNIPADVIKKIPVNMVKKYRVIPLSLEKKRLTLVMADPSDLGAIDEISFVTGLTVKPVVTPEVRLIIALEKYYKIERDARYIPIIENREAKTSAPAAAPKPSPAEEIEIPPLQEEPAHAGEVVDIAEEVEEIEELEEIELLDEAARREIIEEFTIDNVSTELAEAREREEIADIIIGYAGQEFGNAAIFLARGNGVAGWRAFSKGKSVDNISEFQITLDEPSVLKTVIEGKSFYLGPLPDTVNNTRMLEAIGCKRPTAALLIPVIIMGKVVNVIYVDGGDTALGDRVVDMQRLANKTFMAFEILILRHKIMMT